MSMASPAQVQNNTFNASVAGSLNFNVPGPQVLGNLSQPQLLHTAVSFERSNWAGSSVLTDPFYNTSGLTCDTASPGQVLRVQDVVNASLYTLPPWTSLSRLLYTTETLNGTLVPASAYVLWPYAPEQYHGIDGIPLVGFAHGTTGLGAECAPSHLRNLWYQFHAPFALALQGHAIVAPDYAGLGVDRGFDGAHVPHHWSANPEGANNLMDAVQAAQAAFRALSREFVVFGHSEGGGIAWASAQRQAERPVPGYLAAIAASPLSSLRFYGAQSTATANQPNIAFPVMLIAHSLASVYRGAFRLADWLTDDGVKALSIYKALQGCQSVAQEILYTPGVDYVRPNWTVGWPFHTWNSHVLELGNKPIAGPMLVLQGTEDPIINQTITKDRVQAQCQTQPGVDVELKLYEGVGHLPIMYAAQRDWLKWIRARFENKTVETGCVNSTVKPARPEKEYGMDLNWFMEYALYAYETS